MNSDHDRSPRREKDRFGQACRAIGQYGVMAVAVAAPLLFAGARPWIQVVLSGAAWLATGCWLVARKGEVPRTAFTAVASLGLLATLLQLVPLPAFLVGRLSSPALALRLETAPDGSSWFPLTLDAPATVLAGLRGFCCLAILLVSAAAPRSRSHSAGLATAVALSGAAIAILFFFQHWFGLFEVSGIYEEAQAATLVIGTFLNPNHAASFLTVATFLAWGRAQECDGTLRAILWGCVVVLVAALLSTTSRGGVTGAAIGALALVASWMVARYGPGRGLPAALGLLVLGAPFGLLLGLSQRPLDLVSLESLLGQKGRGWRDTLSLISDYPWVGVGRGAFEAPAAIYRSDAESVRLVFPENLVLQMAAEWGLPVTLLLLGLFVASAVEVVRRVSRWEPLFRAAACAVLAVLVHELADFGLELPGVAFPTALALGLVAGRMMISRTTPPSVRRARIRRVAVVASFAAWTGLFVAGIWAASRTMEAEGARLSALVQQNQPPGPALASAMSRHPADYYFPLLAARAAMSSGSPDALRQLNRVQRLFPGWPEGHLMAAAYLADLGRRSQAALEYRLARQLGASIPHEELLPKLGFAHLPTSVPRRTGDLMALAHFLADKRQPRQADLVTAEAVELAEAPSQARMERVKVALSSQDRGFISRAASELASRTQDPAGLELAARGLAEAGDVPALRSLVNRAMKSFPRDGALAMQMAKALYDAGELDAALRSLDGAVKLGLSPADRLAREKLTVEIEARLGHPAAAAAARARVRALGGDSP